MLNCKSCDYLQNNKVCEFTGFIFNKDVEDYDLDEHPCYDYEPSN